MKLEISHKLIISLMIGLATLSVFKLVADNQIEECDSTRAEVARFELMHKLDAVQIEVMTIKSQLLRDLVAESEDSEDARRSALRMIGEMRDQERSQLSGAMDDVEENRKLLAELDEVCSRIDLPKTFVDFFEILLLFLVGLATFLAGLFTGRQQGAGLEDD